MNKRRQPIRTGVIGTGFGRKAHIPALKKHPDFEPVAVLAAHKEHAEEVAKEFGIGWYGTDLDKFLEEPGLDLVVIASRPDVHFPQAEAALEAGRHILLEKPLAESAGQVERLDEIAEEKDLVAAVDFEFRNVPARRQALKMLHDGRIGNLRQIELRDYFDFWADPNSKRPFGWQNEADKGGGVLGMIGSHYLDWFRQAGGDWKEIVGELRVVVPKRADRDGKYHECTADDYAAVSGLLTSGAEAEMTVAACFHYTEFGMRLFGDDGTLEIVHTEEKYGKEKLYLRKRGGEREEVAVSPEFELAPDLPDWRGDLMGLLYDSLSRAIHGEKSDGLPTLQDGLAVQYVMDMVRDVNL
jgi:predicted dehydrogenase